MSPACICWKLRTFVAQTAHPKIRSSLMQTLKVYVYVVWCKFLCCTRCILGVQAINLEVRRFQSSLLATSVKLWYLLDVHGSLLGGSGDLVIKSNYRLISIITPIGTPFRVLISLPPTH